MSGGSYNYLCFKDAHDLLEGGHEEELKRMADALAERGFPDAAKETHDLWLEMRRMRVLLDARIERLKAVWRAVEWVDSNDWGEESITEAIAKYRSEKVEPSKASI